VLTLSKIEAGPGGIAVVPREPRDPGPGEIRLRIEAAGVCGTDMQIYNWAPRMARRMALPRVLGHEASGVVEAVGTGVTNVKAGDHVSLESHIFCGTCKQCRGGKPHICTSTHYPGIDIDGVFAEHAVVPAQIAWVNPPELPHEVAALLEPLGIAVHAATEGSGVSGQAVLVSGCGPIGLMTVAVAARFGAWPIIAADLNPKRLAAAEALGATHLLNAGEVEVAAQARQITRGEGVDVAIEYSGSPAGFQACLAALTRGGEFRLVGAPANPLEVDFTRWLLDCPRIYNIHGRRIWQDWERMSALVLGGQLDLRPVVSHQLPLSEGARAFDLIRAGEALKPLLRPGA